MLDHTETAELKALQARAYGREGSLATEGLARLRELEQKRRGVAPTAAAPDPSSGSGSGNEESVAEPVEVSDVSEKPVAEPVEAPGSTRHPRLRWLVAGAAVAIAIGVGIGWSVWGQSHNAITLTDEQRGWQDELAAEDDFDPGSLYAVGEEKGVVVWLATKDDGKKTCLLMSNGRESSTPCQRTDGVRADGMWAQLEVPTAESYADVTSANLLFSADGHPAVAMDQYRNDFGAEVEYEPEEQKAIDLLIDRGYQQQSLWIVGYFEDRPVWTGAYAETPVEQCLVYVAASGGIEEDCDTWEENMDDPLTLTIGPDDAGSRAAEIVYASSVNGPQYLSITVRTAEGVSVDTESGDPIEFTFDDPTFDDLVVDDKTGELVE